MHRLTLITGLLVIASCRSATNEVLPNGATPAIRAAIQAGDEAWSIAFIAGDTTAMNRLYSDDVVSMQADAPDLVGRSAMVGDLAHTFATRKDTILKVVTVIGTLEQAGDLAWESGHVTITRANRDSVATAPRTGRFKYITFWQRGGDGKWRIRRDLGVGDVGE